MGWIFLYLVVIVCGALGGCCRGSVLGHERDVAAGFETKGLDNMQASQDFRMAMSGMFLGAIGAAVALALLVIFLRWALPRWRARSAAKS